MTGMKRIRRLLALCLLLTAAAGCLPLRTAEAAKRMTIAVYGTCGTQTVRVEARYKNEKYTLSIPGSWDLTQLYTEITGKERIYIGKKEIVSGQVNDFSDCLGKNQALYNQKKGKIGKITVLQGSEIPCLYLTVNKKELYAVNKSKDNEITEAGVLYQEADGSCGYEGGVQSFKGRGNVTFKYSKKAYQIKLAQKADLSGLGKARTWLLLANWLDLSLLRNQILLDLAGEIGIRYAVDCQPVDLWINGAYNGLYLLTEKVQIGKQRIDIYDLEDATVEANAAPVSEAKSFKEEDTQGLQMLRGYELPADPPDISGGYILEIEKSYRFRDKIKNGFKTKDGISVTVKEPTYASRAQVTFIGTLFNDFHKATLAADGHSPDTGRYYMDFIDLPSFTRKYWMEELAKNYDAMASSQFYYKDSDQVDTRFHAGPCWDYDLCMGNIDPGNFYSGTKPENDFLKDVKGAANLYRHLYKHPDFQAALKQVYREVFEPALRVLDGTAEPRPGSRLKSFSAYAAAIEKSAAMNYARWPESLVKNIVKRSGMTHTDSVNYLGNWIATRHAYLNSVWLAGD